MSRHYDSINAYFCAFMELDLMVFTPNLNLRYRKELVAYLEEDLRIDMEDLVKFDTDLLSEICKVSKKKVMIQNLIKIIEDERNI